MSLTKLLLPSWQQKSNTHTHIHTNEHMNARTHAHTPLSSEVVPKPTALSSHAPRGEALHANTAVTGRVEAEDSCMSFQDSTGDSGDKCLPMHSSMHSAATALPACCSLWEVPESFLMSVNTGLQQPTVFSDIGKNKWGIF